MARRRDFVRGAAAISQRRKTTWLEIAPSDFTLTTGATLLFVLTTAEKAMRPFTVVRTRIELALRSDQAAAIEIQQVGFGLAVVSDQAVAVGVTAVPNPVADIASDLWFTHQLMYADESALTDRTRGHGTMTVDSKAMRKVADGQDLAVVAELTAASAGLILTVGGRILIKNS